MSQRQPQRPQGQGQGQQQQQLEEPIKYGDVFPVVSGELASKPIKPQDAAMMQKAENVALGQTSKGGPAAVMQSAATRNEKAGFVGHTEVNDVTGEQGVSVTETGVPGRRFITESIAGQVVGIYDQPAPITMTYPTSALGSDAITIGEALEATAISAGDKPVDESDAAAIQAAEVRATATNVITPGGVAAAAQSAASVNARMIRDDDKRKLGDILENATLKLPADKAVTREDAEGVIGAELRNNPSMSTHPGGVAESVAAAARVNQSSKID